MGWILIIGGGYLVAVAVVMSWCMAAGDADRRMGLKCLLLAALPLFAGCASMDQPPAAVDAVFASVRQRVPYQHYRKADWRYVPAGTVQPGNCAVQAWTAYVDLRAAGLSPALRFCQVPGGEQHVMAVADGWALDQRFRAPVRVADANCF